MQTLIIDGYNVIYAIPEIEDLMDESLEAARTGLIKLLERLKNSRKDIGRIYVVFDSRGQERDQEVSAALGITAVYTSKGRDADKKIIEIIRDSVEPGSITVVSNDNFLYNNTRAHGGRIKTVEEFRRMLK